MKEIELTKGFKAIVDDEDYERLRQYRWYYAYGYAMRAARGSHETRGPAKYMHYEIVDRVDGKVIDHINRQTLDNRKCNLRYADQSQNKANSKRTKRLSASGYVGVYFEPAINKWRARYQAYKNRKTIGYFSTPEEAARAYDRAMKDAFGDYALLNFQ